MKQIQKRKEGKKMNLFGQVNAIFSFLVPIMNWFWNFPTNVPVYKAIPLIGGLPLMILLIFGCGIYFTVRTAGVQFRYFKKAYKLVMERKKTDVGINAFASFMISTASRVGPGNIAGVTGAISVGGPGALFWLWLAAIAGMAISFAESVLAQIYKEQRGNEYVGGYTFYSVIIGGGKKYIGKIMAILFLFYAFCGHPVQTYQIFGGIGIMVQGITGQAANLQSWPYYLLAVIMVAVTAYTLFKGLTAVSDMCSAIVPAMSIAYTIMTIVLIAVNLDRIPYFFQAVFVGAFTPEAMFGGAMGIALAQGVKRALNSNDAGKGVLTIPAAVAAANHPVEQGFVNVLGVFFDTMICTMTGFIIVAGSSWIYNPDWAAIKGNKIAVLADSIAQLAPNASLQGPLMVFMGIAYALFAYSSLIGLMAFTPVAVSAMFEKKSQLNIIRGLAVFCFTPLGIICLMAGQSLDNLWAFTDLATALLCFANLYFVMKARKTIIACFKDYEKNPIDRFISKNIGIDTSVWTVEAAKTSKGIENKELAAQHPQVSFDQSR
jgi:AGCS family alanine or glycine:cation symporter